MGNGIENVVGHDYSGLIKKNRVTCYHTLNSEQVSNGKESIITLSQRAKEKSPRGKHHEEGESTHYFMTTWMN